MNNIVGDSNITLSQPKKENLGRELTKKVRLWSLSSTSHGLPRIVESKNCFIKLMWLAFLLASIVLSSLLIIQNVNEFLRFDVFTKIRVVQHDEIKFPLITLCTLKPLQSNNANEYYYDYLKAGINFNISKYFENNHDDASSNITADIEDINWPFYMTQHPNFNKTLRKSFVQMNENNIACFYERFTCQPSDFVPYYDLLYGSCYQFNSGRDLNGSKIPIKVLSRDDHGLILEFFIGRSDQHFPYIYEKNNSGAVIYINDHDYFPIRQHGIFIKTGTTAFIRLKRIETETIPYPYSNCVEADKVDTLLSRELKKLGINYTRRNCLIMCEQMALYEVYGCYTLYLPPILNATPCNRDMYTLFNLSKCFEHCPHECKSVDFEFSISYSDFPSLNYYTTVLNNSNVFQELLQTEDVTYDMVKNSFINVVIFFDQLKSTLISESPSMTLIDLIGNIGGTLGLFIGVSLLSFVEIIELFVDIFTIFIKKSVKNDY